MRIISKDNISSWILFVVALLLAVVFMGDLPDMIPIHYSLDGTVDSFGSKYMLFLIPIVILAMIIIAEVSKNFSKPAKTSNRYYYQIIFVINAIFISLEIYTIALACDMKVTDVKNFILVIVGMLVMTFGNMMPKFGHGMAIGIRTKWTLADEQVWYLTHRFCAKLWFVGGGLLVVTAFLGGIVRMILLIAIVAVLIVVPVLYSKYKYKNITNK